MQVNILKDNPLFTSITEMTTPNSATAPLEIKSATDRLNGCVKWFNNKAGYGFITVNDEFVYGDKTYTKGTDLFVHHSSIQVKNQQYKYLVQGEYIEFTITLTNNGEHSIQAADVSGISFGKLMCETRNELKQTRVQYQPSSGEEETVNMQLPRSKQDPVRSRGQGPREGGEWTQVKKTTRAPRKSKQVEEENKV